jgi:hypothetical protein
VENREAHYLTLDNPKFISRNVWTATIHCHDPERMALHLHAKTKEPLPERVISKDCRSEGEANRWAKDMVERYESFYKEFGFHFHARWQFRIDGKPQGWFRSMPDARKAATRYVSDTHGRGTKTLWINEKRRPKKPATYAELALYDDAGERIDHPLYEVRERSTTK